LYKINCGNPPISQGNPPISQPLQK
jgi:hypothetical protein